VGIHLEGQEKSRVVLGKFDFFQIFFWGKMVSLASVEEDFMPLGALNHLVNVVLPNDSIELQTFFQFNGIADLYDFMSSDSDFKTP
jgi:hypothetical protein